MSESSVYCIKRSTLLDGYGTWTGINSDRLVDLYKLLQSKGEFRPREEVETDDDYLQLVPWIIVQRYDRLWVMQRVLGPEEPRINSPLKLGVRGHIEKPDDDIQVPDPVAWGTRRLWTTTMSVDRTCRAHLVGALMDSEHEVDRYHLGLIFFVGLQNGIPEIDPSLNLTGSFRSTETLRKHRQDLDQWSKWMVESLNSGRLTRSLPGDRLVFRANQRPQASVV